MSLANEIHRQRLLTALETGRTLNIQQEQGDTLIGVKVLEFDSASGKALLRQGRSTATITLGQITGIEFEYLVMEKGKAPIWHGANAVVRYFDDITVIKFYNHDPLRVEKMLYADVVRDQVVFLDIDGFAHLESISQVEKIHTR
jgi:hypothetical protein